MKMRVCLLFAASFAALVACSQEQRSPFVPLPFKAGPQLQSDHTRTTAWGRLVDDPTGRPLPGVRVRLYPWTPCRKTSPKSVTCPPPLRTTQTRAKGKFEFRSVPNGHYLLTIGDDDPADLVRPTIHDQVWFKGGVQHLVAPTLPAEPYDAPFHMHVPKVERSGLYRLMTIDMHQRLCTKAWDDERAKRHLSPAVNDEWLLENTRTMAAYRATITTKTKHVYGLTNLVGWGWGFLLGGSSCAEIVSAAFNQRAGRPIARRAEVEWFGGVWFSSPHGDDRQGQGFAEFPVDVRRYTEGQKISLLPPWP